MESALEIRVNVGNPGDISGYGKMVQEPTAQKLHIEWLRRAVSKVPTSALHSKRRHAWDVARRAAGILREKYGATRVRAFGSILRPERFHACSDVDLAVLFSLFSSHLRLS